jgi:hypothetical protein
VQTWLGDFNTKLAAELDVKHSQKDYGAHFSRWLPGELLKQKKNKTIDQTDAYISKMTKPKFFS